MGGLKKMRILHVREEAVNDAEMDEDVTDKEFEEEEDDDDGDDGEIKLNEPSKNAIYNREGLLEKLGDISWPSDLEWNHRLTINFDQGQDIDVNDDLTRELAFYNQALEGTRQAFAKLQSMGIPFLRPPDYYAEMVKSDAHMVKVKGRLLSEKQKMEEAEERRKAREAKKISKEVQAQKLKERSKQKKQEIESVKKWRKQRQNTGFKGEQDVEFEFEDGKGFSRAKKMRPGVSAGDRSGGMERKGFKAKKGGDKGGKNREYRDSKFGYGGRKGMKKQNTAETTNDFKGYNGRNSGASKKRKRKFLEQERLELSG